MKCPNRIITVEIHECDDRERGFPTHHFNFRIKGIRDITDKQRLNFLKHNDNQTGNESELRFLLDELKTKLEEITK